MPGRDPGPQPAGQIIQAGGRDFHVITLGERDGRDALVLLHGGGPGISGWTDFAAVAPALARERFCVLVDLPLYGKADRRPIEGPVWTMQAQALRALMDEMALGPADFACNSWGGSVALCLAAISASHVRSIVLTGSMPAVSGPFAPLIGDSGLGAAARDAYYGGEGPTLEKMRLLLQRLEWFEPALLPEQTVQLRFAQSCPPVPASWRGAAQDLAGVLEAVSCPVLCLWGEADPFLPAAYAQALAAALPRGQAEIIPRTSHHPAEEQPDAYLAALRKFLSQTGHRI